MPCPEWLQQRLEKNGNRVPFSTFMDWALHDPVHGAYGAGQLRVGKDGDFVTSPSLGEDFSALLIHQLSDWLGCLAARHPDSLLSVVDVGPGEGDLIAQLITLFQASASDLLSRLEFVLVEINPGMQVRQRKRLQGLATAQCRWCSLAELASEPVNGVMLAHELLDALPVERLILSNGALQRQMVALQTSGGLSSLVWAEDVLPEPLKVQISVQAERDDLQLPPDGAQDGWATEWHHSLKPWMQQAHAALADGMLLVVDYALEASRYYSS